MHPLIGDISELKDAEIEAKILDLSRKYWQTNNASVQHQIAMIIDMYREEMSFRKAKTWEEQNQKRDKGLDDLIKVN